MNTTQHTARPKRQIVLVNPNYPGIEFITSRTFDTTPVVNRDDIEDADIVEETTDSSAQLMLGEQAMRIIFKSLRKDIDQPGHSGDEYEVEWGPYVITARHHYKCHIEKGGDCYCGLWEPYGVVDRDEIEVVSVYNVIDDIEDATVVKRLNDFYKNNEDIY